jgi:hypothetical protein
MMKITDDITIVAAWATHDLIWYLVQERSGKLRIASYLLDEQSPEMRLLQPIAASIHAALLASIRRGCESGIRQWPTDREGT